MMELTRCTDAADRAAAAVERPIKPREDNIDTKSMRGLGAIFTILVLSFR